MLRIELGGGTKPRAGFINVDKFPIPQVHHVVDFEDLITTGPYGAGPATGHQQLPFADNTVGEIYSCHCFEHIHNLIGLIRECARIGSLGCRVEIVVPHWLSPMALCHDHKQVIPPEQIDHWCNSAIDYWWGGSPKRFYYNSMEQRPTAQFAEIRGLFPRLNSDQIMRYISGAAHEVSYIMEIGKR